MEKIEEATQEGYLGVSSKCSTMGINRNYGHKTMVICVYTQNYKDKKDVFCVRQVLRKMDFEKKIPYKTNETTRDGKYAINRQKTSLYYD